MFVPIIQGTSREGNKTHHVAHFIEAKLQQQEGVETKYIEPNTFCGDKTIAAWTEDKAIAPWREIVARADGFIIVTPEYNHGYPGELKLLLDAAYKEYQKKPVALCGVSAGGLGGARVVEHIKPVLNALKMIVVPDALYVSHVGDVFAEDGTLKDESYQEKVQKLITDLQEYIQA